MWERAAARARRSSWVIFFSRPSTGICYHRWEGYIVKCHFCKRVTRLETWPSISTVPEAAARADADDIVAALKRITA